MNFFRNIFFIFFALFSLISCNKNDIEEQSPKTVLTPQLMYQEGMIALENKNYEIATELFNDLEYTFPLSKEAIQAQIMSAFIDYVNLNYSDAIIKLNRIILRYPSYKNIDYAYYIRAICYYEQIENQDLDGKNSILAQENFQQIINRFPNSEYAKDSRQKLILINESIAAKHMYVGKFYLERKKYLAALKRYKIIVNDFSQTKFTPEALYRLTEIYYKLGMIDDSRKTASILGYNYPNSKWYKFSYELVEEVELKKKKSLLKKILKPFSNEN